VYEGDPAEIAARYAADGATRLPRRKSVTEHSAIQTPKNLKAAKRNFLRARHLFQSSFGGASLESPDVQRLLDCRGELRNHRNAGSGTTPLRFAEIVSKFGSKIIVGIDADGRNCSHSRGEQSAQTRAVDLARAVAAVGVERIVSLILHATGC